jgi:hypothetical protein
MLKRMRYYDSVVDRELEKGEGADPGIIDGALKAANEAAKDAAPYIHPRLSAVEHIGGGKVSIFAQWRDEFAASVRGLPDPAKIPADRVDYIDVTPTRVAPEPQPRSSAPSPTAQPPPSPTAQPPPKAMRWMTTILPNPTKIPADRP